MPQTQTPSGCVALSSGQAGMKLLNTCRVRLVAIIMTCTALRLGARSC